MWLRNNYDQCYADFYFVDQLGDNASLIKVWSQYEVINQSDKKNNNAYFFDRFTITKVSDTDYIFSANVYACLEGSGQCAIDIPVYQNTRLQSSTTTISTQSKLHQHDPVWFHWHKDKRIIHTMDGYLGVFCFALMINKTCSFQHMHAWAIKLRVILKRKW